MKQVHNPPEGRQIDGFAQQAELDQPGIVREFWDFLRYNKKWWLAPIVLVLLLVGIFIYLSSTALLPFVYPL